MRTDTKIQFREYNFFSSYIKIENHSDKANDADMNQLKSDQ